MDSLDAMMKNAYQVGRSLWDLRRRLVSQQFGGGNLTARHEVLSNATGAIDVRRDNANNHIEYAEHAAHDKNDEIPEHVDIHLANR